MPARWPTCPSTGRLTSCDIVGLTSQVRHNYFGAGFGSRFELFESLPAARRPNYAAAYDFCFWPGARGKPIRKFHDMIVAQLVEAGAGSGEAPAIQADGWRVVDKLDVADLASEAGHEYDLRGRQIFEENIIFKFSIFILE